MYIRSVKLALVLLLVVCVGNFLPAWAQSTSTGTVAGSVSDPTGAVVAGAAVTLTDIATNIARTTITNALMQHVIDYTPYEGLEVTGWPVSTIRRGEIVMTDGIVQAEPGTGQFLARAPYDLIKPTGNVPFGFDASAFLV